MKQELQREIDFAMEQVRIRKDHSALSAYYQGRVDAFLLVLKLLLRKGDEEKTLA